MKDKNKIYEMEKEDIVSFILGLVPPLEWSDEDFWRKYGLFYFGLVDTYNWNEDELLIATMADLLLIIASISSHYRGQYEGLYDVAYRKNNVNPFLIDQYNYYNKKGVSSELKEIVQPEILRMLSEYDSME